MLQNQGGKIESLEHYRQELTGFESPHLHKKSTGFDKKLLPSFRCIMTAEAHKRGRFMDKDDNVLLFLLANS